MKLSFSFFAAIIAIGIAFSSCGGNSSQADSQADSEEVSEDVKPKVPTAEELGKQITEIYLSSLAEVTDLIKDRPAAADIQPKIAELKEKYVKQLVELGEIREGLEESDRSKIDLNLRIGLQSAYSDETFTAYAEALNHYLSEAEFYKLLSDFNIITQYSNFDLLKQQEPKEAERLGIE